MHIDEGVVQALIHGELAAEESARWHTHLRACRECAARAGQARTEEDELFGALAVLDVPPPPLSADEVRRRAGKSDDVVSDDVAADDRAADDVPSDDVAADDRAAARRRWAGWPVAAAAALAVVLAGSLYAFPGSPLRDAIDLLLARAASAPDAPAAVADPSGVAVPAGEDFTVTFEGVSEADTLRVHVVDGELLSLSASRPATFRSRSAGLSVSGDPANLYWLEVPRSAPLVRVRAGGRVIAEVRSGVLSADVSGGLPIRGPMLEIRP